MLLFLYQKAWKQCFPDDVSLEWDLDFAEKQKCQNQVLMKVPIDTFPNKIFRLLTFTGEKNPKQQKNPFV